MEKETNVRILSIREEDFSIQYGMIPADKDDCNILTGYSCVIDPRASTLSIIMWIRLQDKEHTGIDQRDIVSFKFSYNVFIEGMMSFVKRQDNGQKALQLPTKIWKTIMGDTYATGRVLLAQKLADTPLQDFYLPFNRVLL